MVYVIKANGEKEAFDDNKIINSINRAGVPINVQSQALSYVKKNLYPNIPTSKIYKNITNFLQKTKNPYFNTRYKLKEAIMTLGPTGYPFEDFISKILQDDGYKTETRQIVCGKCVNHEIDVIARKDDKKIMIEAKFHNFPGTKTDVHVALYTKARFEDVKNKNGFNEVWLVTNTKCTIDAISYSQCVGIKIISWSYPQGESLQDLVEKSGRIPITALTSLSESQKQKLLQNHIVLCKDIKDNPLVLSRLNLSNGSSKTVIDEIEFLNKSLKSYN